MMPVGAFAGGIIVAVAEPGLGREAALRLPYLAGAFSAYRLARKRHLAINALVAFVVIVAGMLVTGVVTSLVRGLPVLAGI